MSKNQHVVPRDSEWAIKGEGSNRVTSVHKTQKEAIEVARDIARNRGGDVIIHGRDGRIRDRDSYGSDQIPMRVSAWKGKSVRVVLFPVTDSTTDKEEIREAVREVVQESRTVN